VKALRAYRDDAVPPGLDKESKGPPVASLAVFTSGTGQTSGMAPTLVWLLKFADVPVIEFGPNSRGVDSGSRCPFLVVIDATSGKRLLPYQTCTPRRPAETRRLLAACTPAPALPAPMAASADVR
jgi:hypothetical protein